MVGPLSGASSFSADQRLYRRCGQIRRKHGSKAAAKYRLLSVFKLLGPTDIVPTISIISATFIFLKKSVDNRETMAYITY